MQLSELLDKVLEGPDLSREGYLAPVLYIPPQGKYWLKVYTPTFNTPQECTSYKLALEKAYTEGWSLCWCLSPQHYHFTIDNCLTLHTDIYHKQTEKKNHARNF